MSKTSVQYGRYRVLYVDPPWQYKVWSRATGSGRSAESHYPTMTLKELQALPVAKLAAKDCCLFMWATWPTVLDAFALAASWGFEYKTCAFLWAKLNRRAAERWTTAENPVNWAIGMGYWTRANSEPCLLFTRGRPKRLTKNVRQLIVAPIGKHSAKPLDTYDRIERLVGGPYCELFARSRYQFWACWGNEVESTVTL